jgi:hypothetical protein
MSKHAHIRRRQDSDDEDNNQPANEDSNGPNSNDGSDNGYANIFPSLFLYSLFFLYRTTIEDLKLIQKLRQRKNGVSAEELALGKQINPLFSSRKADVCFIPSHTVEIFHLLFSFSQMIHINSNPVVLEK